MENIRIVKRKKNKGSGIIWGILIAAIILGAVAWLLIDQDVIEREQFSLQKEPDENESYGEFSESPEKTIDDEFTESSERENYDEFRESDQLQENSDRNVVKSYVSFVNREVITVDIIENQTKIKAVSLFQKAVNEVEKDSGFDQYENADNSDSSITLSDSNKASGSNSRKQAAPDSIEQLTQENQQNNNKSLITAGYKLMDIQEREYPSLSKMGEVLNSSIIELEKTEQENSENLKEFFIASSSLLQEIDSERNDLAYNK
jgi:hypothetical protein